MVTMPERPISAIGVSLNEERPNRYEHAPCLLHDEPSRQRQGDTPMSREFQLFSTKQLNALNKKQRQALWKAFTRQIRTSPQIRKMLKAKLRPVYGRLKPES